MFRPILHCPVDDPVGFGISSEDPQQLGLREMDSGRKRFEGIRPLDQGKCIAAAARRLQQAPTNCPSSQCCPEPSRESLAVGLRWSRGPASIVEGMTRARRALGSLGSTARAARAARSALWTATPASRPPSSASIACVRAKRPWAFGLSGRIAAACWKYFGGFVGAIAVKLRLFAEVHQLVEACVLPGSGAPTTGQARPLRPGQQPLPSRASPGAKCRISNALRCRAKCDAPK